MFKIIFSILLAVLVIFIFAQMIEPETDTRVGLQQTDLTNPITGEVPLEDSMSKQVKLASIEQIKALQVSAKRIQIPIRFRQTGRYGWQGKWIPTVLILKVDRTPISQDWTADETSGTGRKNEAIWIESSDSVGFSIGITCAAYIKEEDAATFLYFYPSGSLASVMNSEIRGRVQTSAANFVNPTQASDISFTMDALRSRKVELTKAIKADVETFFKARGITITTLGIFGGFQYENKEIQKSIDDVFVAQQKKNIALAELQAQQDTNKRIEMAALAVRNAAITKAEGEANKNPAFLELRKLEVEQARIVKWNGQYPTTYWATGDTSDLGIIVNTPASTSLK
ncbi:MAG: SPFH domain-containing protein [Candidatus Micrarchaeia archaeon]|jgi:hypothetical protein